MAMLTTMAHMLSAAVLSVAAAAADDAGAKKDLAAMQGTWKLAAVEIDGETGDPSAQPARPPRWVIRGNKVYYAGEELALLTVDPAAMPKTVDLTLSKPKRTYEGVYALEEDTLKICLNRTTEGVKERPLGFATKGKADLRLLVFKRLNEPKADAVEHLSGFIGIALGYNKQKELVITQLIDDAPAKKAGLKKDDIVLQIDGRDASDLRAAVRAVQECRPRSEITVRVKRGGEDRNIKVKVGVVPFYLFLLN
jgi:uncharacterized protein (TIGR03067 family)